MQVVSKFNCIAAVSNCIHRLRRARIAPSLVTNCTTECKPVFFAARHKLGRSSQRALCGTRGIENMSISIFISSSIYTYISTSVSIPISKSISISIFISIFISLSISISLSIYISISLYISTSIYISISIYLDVCLSVPLIFIYYVVNWCMVHPIPWSE